MTAVQSGAGAAQAPLSEGAKISGATAAAIAIADMVGIGVFTSLGFQVGGIPSPFSLLMLWIVGGAAALCGALCYAELAAAFPRAGGEYNFLSRIFHPAAGFLAGWVSGTVGFAAPIALAAMAFGEYFSGIVPGAPVLPLALGAVWLVSLVHLRGIRHGGAFQNIFTILKLALILGFIAAGFAVSDPQPISFAPSAQDLTFMASAPFAISLVFVLYSYSGWNAATYIADEVRDPQKALPLSIFVATLTVIILYVALNAVFLYTTPMDKMAGQVDVALIAGQHIFGPEGGRIAGALICLGLISTISAMAWIGPRVTMAMGEDAPALRIFARKGASGVPRTAILLQLGVATFLLLTQTFEAVINFIQFSLTFCSFLTVLGLIVLRHTQPGLPRPYRVWGYPLTPLVFLSVTLFMMIYLVAEKPTESLASAALMLSGLAVYAFVVRPWRETAPNWSA